MDYSTTFLLISGTSYHNTQGQLNQEKAKETRKPHTLESEIEPRSQISPELHARVHAALVEGYHYQGQL